MTFKSVHGVLLLDKPPHITSNAALQKVKRLFHAKKAGHTGSLDPIATGMLPICFGEATKFSKFLLEANKSYRVVARLGVQTTTGDSEGDIVASSSVASVTTLHIQQVMTRFLGEIEQIPPMYSAIKYQGQPLYKLARQGIEISRKSRRVTIFSLQFEQFKKDHLTFEVHCSKGTYIRTLVEDIGHALGIHAHVVELRRLTVAPYAHASMYTLTQLEAIAALQPSELFNYLLPVDTAVQLFPVVTLSTDMAFYLRMGQAIRATHALAFSLDGTLVRLMSEDACFLGMGKVMPDGRIKPHRLISSV